MAQKKRGPGRPRWVVKRQEVQHSEGSVTALAWWQMESREDEGAAAIRRALVVLFEMARRGHERAIRKALRETER